MCEVLTDPSSYRFTAALAEDSCWNDIPARGRLKPGNCSLSGREIFGEFSFVYKVQLRIGLSCHSLPSL